MPTLDTNVLLRLVLRDIPAQADKVEMLLRNGDTYHVADISFCEMVWVLRGSSYQQDRQAAMRSILAIAHIPSILCNRAVVERAAALYVEHPSISFADAMLACYAEENDAMPLLSFDKKLARTLPKLVKAL